MQSIAKKPAETAINKKLAGDEAESVEEPRTLESSSRRDAADFV